MAPDPLYATRILDLRAEPVKVEYLPGEDVVFTGTLEIHDFWTCYWGAGAWTAGERIVIYSGDAEIASSYAGTDGVFHIPTMLPITQGIYAYRAHFPGRNWLAARDPCWSDTILVSVAGGPPPPPPPPPEKPPEWAKYLIYGSIGLIAIGVVLIAVRS